MDGRSLTIDAGAAALEADLCLPPSPRGLVVFVHGSGSSRLSPRNQAVASRLQRAALATVLFDLLTPAEARQDQRDQSLRFRHDLGVARLQASLAWLQSLPELAALGPVGLFGASSGAAAALEVAATQPGRVGAVVSRGGRPDLAGEALERVQAATLLIVGGRDLGVLRMNRQAMQRLHCPHRLEVVAGAGHLFDEAGSLEVVGLLAQEWFLSHLQPAPGRAGGPATRQVQGRPDVRLRSARA